ncbi:hypothetical protein RFI_05626, partial [Reticulomyxa filosa]
FPLGLVIHRPAGIDSKTFKEKHLRLLSQHFNVVGYIGDRLVDDCVFAIRVNVRPILVIPNQWVYSHHIQQGLSGVINELSLFKQEQQKFGSDMVDYVRASKFWNMSYDDIIPLEFATDRFGEKHSIWPPAVLDKQKTTSTTAIQSPNSAPQTLSLEKK